MYLRKLFQFYFLLFNAKKIWKSPKSVNILIFDNSGSEFLINYFRNYTYSILYTRGESINIPILLKSFFRRKNYFNCYIETVSPIILITFIDNSIFFYQVKKSNPHITTIFIQNGIRSFSGDIFEYLEENAKKLSFNVDFMLCFNDSIAKKYNEYISGKTLSIGSFKNNILPLRVNIKLNTRTVVYISQYRAQNTLLFYSQGRPIYWSDFYKAEHKFLPLLIDYCFTFNLKLAICGCSHDNFTDEKNFYTQILGSSNWAYIPKKSSLSAYEIIDKHLYIVTIDSTLGYEALIRKKKVAFFPIRSNYTNLSGTTFGWPNNFINCGKFWSHHIDREHVFEILKFTFESNDKTWNDEVDKVENKLLFYDKANTKFKKLINSILEK